MYCVIYEFTVNTDQLEKFKTLWHQLTLSIHKDSDSLGARLHKVIDDDYTWVAYAQWPSQQVYDLAAASVNHIALQEAFIETCTGIKILYQLDCVDNLF